jgi:hypothetical protein
VGCQLQQRDAPTDDGATGASTDDGTTTASMPKASESTHPVRLDASTCWAMRQHEKEATEQLKIQLLSCQQSAQCASPARGAGSAEAPGWSSWWRSWSGSTAPKARTSQAAGEREGLFASVRNVALRDTATGLCSWQALTSRPDGAWLPWPQANKFFLPSNQSTRSHTLAQIQRGGDDGTSPFGPGCRSLASYYNCPAFEHNRTWVPDIVRLGNCSMHRAVSPPMLRQHVGRQLKVLAHGDSLLKGLLKSFVCGQDAHVRHHLHVHHLPKTYSNHAETCMRRTRGPWHPARP